MFKRRFLFQFSRPSKPFVSVWIFPDSVVSSTSSDTKLYYRSLDRKLDDFADTTCNLELLIQFLILSNVYAQKARKSDRTRIHNIDETLYLANVLALLKYYEQQQYVIHTTYKWYRHTSDFYDTIHIRSLFGCFCV